MGQLTLKKVSQRRFSFVLFIALSLCFVNIKASTYYFSSVSGSDDNVGNASDSAWQSKGKLTETIATLQPGDVVYLERGSVWYEVNINMNSISGYAGNEIRFEAYGSGDKPVLSGGKDVSGTFTANGNLWTTTSASFTPHDYVITPGGLLINNNFHAISRHPNTTYYKTSTQGVDDFLDDYTNSWSENELEDGQVAARCVGWAWSISNITSNTANRIYFNKFIDYDVGQGGETTYYYLQNLEQGTDLEGEWFYKDNSYTIFSGSDLNTKQVEVTMVDTLLKANNCSNLKINNIEFRMVNSILVYIKGGSNIEITDCNFRVAGFSGMFVDGTSDFTVERNYFNRLHGNGITANYLGAAEINNNTFINTSITRGHVNNPNDRAGAAITHYYGNDIVNIRNNYFDSIMIAMQSHWSNASWYFEENYVKNYGMMCSDLAAVYLGGDWRLSIKKYINKNIIVDAHTNSETSEGYHPAKYAHAIYWDYDTHGAICDSNTILNTNGAIMSNKNYGNRFNSNVVYNATMDLKDLWAGCFYLDAKIDGQSGPKLDTFNFNTIVFTDHPSQAAFVWHDVTEGGFEIMENKYISPFVADIPIHREVRDYSTYGEYNLDEYCSKEGLECSSTFNETAWSYASVDPLEVSKDDFVKVVYNPTTEPAYKYLNAKYIDPDGVVYDDSVLVVPYYSKVLMYYNKTDNINDPPVLNSETVILYESDFSGTSVVDLNATDPDAAQTLTYSISSGNTGGLFQIDASTGLLRFILSDVDFSSSPTYELTVQVIDNGETPLSDNAVITVQLEAGATLTNHAPVINETDVDIREAEYSGTTVIDLDALDEDLGQTLSYSIITGTNSDLFLINSSTGVLSFASSEIDFTGDPLYEITVRATDDGSPVLYGEAVISIQLEGVSIVDDNHAPIILAQSLTTSYGAVTPSVIGTVEASDEDTGQELTYELVSGNMDGHFSIDTETGELNLISLPTNYVPVTYNLVISVTDDGAGSLSAEASVTVYIASSDQVVYINPDNTSDGDADGSYDHPYASWSEVTWEENSSYLQKRGTISNESKILITANHVTLGDYGAGDKPVINSLATDYALKSIDKNNVTIKNLRIDADLAIGCVYFIGSSCSDNAIENCELIGADYGLRIIDGDSYIVKYNVFENKVDGIYSIAEDAEIYYNVFKGNHKAVNLSSYSSYAKIYNNVFYNNRQGISAAYAEVTLFNNIFYLTQDYDQALNHKLDKVVSDNNIFYPERDGFIEIEEISYDKLDDYQKDYGLDLSSLVLDPLFIDVYTSNFSVSDQSKAIDAGRVVGLSQDFHGQAVPYGGGPDIGMSEALVYGSPTSVSYVDKQQGEKSLSVYPNPSDGRINMKFDGHQDDGTAEIIVNSLAGTQVYHNTFESQVMYVTEVDLTHLPKGLYYFSVRASDEVFTKKIIIE